MPETHWWDPIYRQLMDLAVIVLALTVSYVLLRFRRYLESLFQKLEKRVDSQEIKVRVIRQDTLDRGELKAIKQGLLLLQNGVWTVSDKMRGVFRADGTDAKLRELAATMRHRPKGDPTDLSLEIARLFRLWLLEHLCSPYDMDDMECIVLATKIALEQDPNGHVGEVG